MIKQAWIYYQITLKFTGSSAWNLVFKNLQLATGNSKGAVDLSSTTGANTVTFENVKVKVRPSMVVAGIPTSL